MKVSASNKELSKQKMRTTWRHKFSVLLFAFFADSVSLLIPSFLLRKARNRYVQCQKIGDIIYEY
jgi:hypothetical protein